MDNWKAWIFDPSNKPYTASGLILLFIALPMLLILISRTQNLRSNAAPADALEAEAGVLSGNATPQTDSNASGGSYIILGTNQAQTTGGVYGAGINIDSKDNKRVGASSNVKLSHRFRASTTSQLNSISWALRGGVNPDGSPYSAGTGGTLKISVQTDDGTVNHNPSGTILASLNYTPGNPNGGGTVKQDFPTPATLTAGTLYHIVWENIDPNPTANYISVNEVFTFKKYTPRQPMLSDADYAILYNQGSGWVLQPNDTADMDLIYANGKHDGLAYMQPMPDTDKTGLIGGNNMVREHFTVADANHTVDKAFVRVGKQSGTGNMTITLKNGSTVLGSGTVPASSIINSVVGDGAAAANGDWVSVNFTSPITLVNGQTYDLVLSAPSGNQFSMVPIRHTDDFTVALNSWAFREGTGQRSTDNGATWSNLYLYSPVNTQFYFTTTNNQTSTPTPTTTQAGTTYNVPATIDKTGAADASAALNSWLASVPNGTANNPSIVTFPAGATYRMDHGLKFSNRNYLTFEGNGATLKSNGAVAAIESDSPFALWGGNSNIIIRNFKITGDWPGSYTTTKEGLHAILIQGNNVEAYGNTIDKVWGDAFYVGNFSNTVNIHDNHIISSGRNGVSIISGQNITVSNNTFDRSAYVTFDIEPNNSSETINNVNFKQNTIGKWDTAEFFAIDGSSTGAPISNITVDTNTVTNSSLKAWSASTVGRKTNIKFINNKSTAPAVSGPVFTFSNIDGLTVTGNTQPLSSGGLGSYSNNTNAVTSPNP